MNIPSALLTWTGLRTPPLEEHPSEPQPLHLPTEIIEAMISFIPHHPTSQATLYSLCLVSWSWHSVAITRLYESPYLYGKNYDPFVRTICPSLNRHVKKSDLAGLVRCLDMSRLVHQGSRSTTARVLGRCKGGMVEFTAPQANFGINCLAALSKCINLRTLDLSLLSESISYKELSSTLRSLTQLSTLKFPRSATKDTDRSPPVSVTWPPHLSTLSLSGNMHGYLWASSSHPPCPPPPSMPILPTHLTSLTIERSTLDLYQIAPILSTIGGQLTTLTLRHLPRLDSSEQSGQLSDVFILCPNLHTLSLPHGYLPSLANIFSSSPPTTIDPHLHPLTHHPLQILEITPHDQGPNFAPPESLIPPMCMVLKPANLFEALLLGYLPQLRKFRVARGLNWGATFPGSNDGHTALVGVNGELVRRAERIMEESGEGMVSFGEKDVGIFFFG